MILELLSPYPAKLFRLAGVFNEVKGHDSCPNEILNVEINVRASEQEIMALLIPSKSTNSYPAYFLPWNSDYGYCLSLPSESNERKLFITAELTGCCVGVQRMANGSVIVRHYNVADKSNLNVNDFLRYGDTFWLLPEKFRDIIGNNRYFQNYYNGYCGGTNPTVFWGEYREGWNFYYQTPDKVIHNFPAR